MRYGTFRYGDGTKYGESPVVNQLWSVLIDWNGDGVFDHGNEAIHLTGMKIVRGRKFLLNQSGDGFEPTGIGTMTLHLNNYSGRFNPYNTHSPLYPYVRPGVRVVVRTRLPTSGVIYPVFTGQINDIIPISGSYEQVKILVQDGMKWLEGQSINLATQSNLRINEAIAQVLTASDWQWGSALDVSNDTIAWFWSPDYMKSNELLHELASKYLGQFFIATDGSARFYNRHRVYSQAKLRIEQEQVFREIMLRTPWDVVRNQITVGCNPRAAQSLSVVWSLTTQPAIAAGSTYEVWGTFRVGGVEVPVSSHAAPTPTTDYLVNTLADGTGTNLTGSCTVSVTVFGSKARFRVTNNSASNGFITRLQLRATPLTSNKATTDLVDATSRALYGPRVLNIDSVFLQNANLMNDIADALLMALKDALIYPTIKIIHRPEIQYTVDLFDIIDLVLPKLGIGGSHWLAHIEHTWLSESGQGTETIFTFEPVKINLAVIWRFDARIGNDTIFGF